MTRQQLIDQATAGGSIYDAIEAMTSGELYAFYRALCEAAAKETMIETVELYEDNAGGLYFIASPFCVDMSQHSNQRFEDDARGWIDGDWGPGDPDERLVGVRISKGVYLALDYSYHGCQETLFDINHAETRAIATYRDGAVEIHATSSHQSRAGYNGSAYLGISIGAVVR